MIRIGVNTGIHSLTHTTGNGIQNSLNRIIGHEIVSMTRFRHIGGAGVGITIASCNSIDLGNFNIRQFLSSGFIVTEENPFVLLTLECLHHVVIGSRQSTFISHAQDVDEVKIVIMVVRGTIDIHAQVNLQKYVLLIGQRESHRVLATHGVTHGNNLTEVNKVQRLDGVPHSFRTHSGKARQLTICGFRGSGGHIGIMAARIIPSDNRIASACQLQCIGPHLLQHIIAAMADHGQRHRIFSGCGFGLIEHCTDLIAICTGQIQFCCFHLSPGRICANNQHQRE